MNSDRSSSISDVVALMIFRMGVYMMRLWERVVRDQSDLTKLPPIMPLLIHNSETGWTAATAFQNVVDMAELDEAVRLALVPHVPHFELRLIDLSHGRADNLLVDALTTRGARLDMRTAVVAPPGTNRTCDLRFRKPLL